MAHRLLDLLCERHPAKTREELLALVLAGDVYVNDERIREPAKMLSADAWIEIRAGRRYVSRGGLKLLHAIEAWRLPVSGKCFLDAGASTGGFTDCLLRSGAVHVHAVDVGYNQLEYRLRTDSRVSVHEKTNIMRVTSLDPAPHAAVADLSFRSLAGAACHLLDLTTDTWAVLLIKPQFEWRDAPESFDGIVPSELVPDILNETIESLAQDGVAVNDLVESPITGRKGNREFLARVSRSGGRAAGELLASLS